MGFPGGASGVCVCMHTYMGFPGGASVCVCVCVYTPHLDPFIFRWTFRLFPCLGCCR